MPVCVKLLPLNSNGLLSAAARACEKQSPWFRADAERPLPKRRQASRARFACVLSTATQRAASRLARVPRGGPRVTAILCFLAFVAVANAGSGGVLAVYAGHPRLHADRLLINVGPGVLLSSWALARVRRQWAQEAPASSVLVRHD